MTMRNSVTAESFFLIAADVCFFCIFSIKCLCKYKHVGLSAFTIATDSHWWNATQYIYSSSVLKYKF